MAIFKCKMCGGDLNVTEEVKIVECEYCGTNQTIPSADNEKKVNLFNRANRLRFSNEFDKAAGVYENIIVEFPEEAEAYWGLCLCKYGIEYVDDPATAKKIPTCHRSSFESIMDDSDFEQVMEYSDAVSRKVYREQAKQIEEIRKGIIEVSANEKPYDIFICYKETAEDGDRTIDSVIAQDVYDELTGKGYRVFFSRVTLEDKLGMEYEPYIFAALNSAKIMLVFGTDYEYFNAVWVKNEWSRYLKLMATDKTKYLIPCYKGVDAYDMPKEFAKLQAQDMGKVGATQDLMRGIEKILPKSGKPVAEVAVAQPAVASNPSVESYLKRVNIFLADGDFKSADEYCEKVLDIDPENAQGYLGKLLAEMRVKNIQALGEINIPFDKRNNFLKIKQFGDAELIATLEGYISSAYARAEATMSSSRLLPSFIAAGHNHTVCVKADGTVVSTGVNTLGQCNVGAWTYITAVSTGYNHTVGLRTDGTVLAVGSNIYGQCNVSGWRNIIAVSAGFGYTVGLKADGTVVATGDHSHGECDVESWRDIVAVSAGSSHTVGLKSDGTVVAAGDNDEGQCNVTNWCNIVAISAGSYHTVGLKSDGTVVAAGYNSNGRCNVQDWSNIVALSAGEYITAGIRADRKVVVTGKTDNYQGNVTGWEDIVAVSAGGYHTLGLRSDGTVVAAGNNEEGQCNIVGLRLFTSAYTIEQERAAQMQAAHIGKQNLFNVGRCIYCGGEFRGLITKKCINCGREKDY